MFIKPGLGKAEKIGGNSKEKWAVKEDLCVRLEIWLLLENFQNHCKDRKQQHLTMIILGFKHLFCHNLLQLIKKSRCFISFLWCLTESENQAFYPENVFKKRRLIKIFCN